VELRGEFLRVSINGRDVRNTDLSKLSSEPTARTALSRRSGRIGFQADKGTVRFRHIRVK
jgi:hypothetical protein